MIPSGYGYSWCIADLVKSYTAHTIKFSLSGNFNMGAPLQEEQTYSQVNMVMMVNILGWGYLCLTALCLFAPDFGGEIITVLWGKMVKDSLYLCHNIATGVIEGIIDDFPSTLSKTACILQIKIIKGSPN